ncbi:MAG: putative sulfate/molybdate transporter [Candidatus Abyssubacteria bacterium]
MRIKSFEFNLRELAGSMGDFGTLFPLAIGYIALCGMDPTGLLVMMGLANIVTGLVYRLPMPIEPMKVLAVVAIAQQWKPSLIYASAFAMGIIWVFFALVGIMEWIAKVTPKSVVRGIQAALGVMLAIEGLKLLSTWWLLGVASLVIVILFRKSKYAPAAIVLVLLGLAIMALKGQLQAVAPPQLTLPPLTSFRPAEVWESLVKAGFAQIPLTATNAIIATAALITHYWPDRSVGERQLSLNHGLMNLAIPFFGGMPMCHGAGGLAGQYYFGARTGGTNIIEGVIEVAMGLFLAASIATIFAAFPMAIIGAMMFLVGLELVKFARDLKANRELVPLGATVAGALIANMPVGFAVGMAVHYLLFRSGTTSAPPKSPEPELVEAETE